MYVKLFGSILDSSIWAEDHATVRVWITMLAMANEDGVVAASPSGLARRANVSPEECRKALGIFQQPDIESKSQEWGGRRIEPVDGGWLLLNYAKYREMRTKKQVIDAARQARKRRRDTSRSSRDIHVEAEAHAEAYADTQAKNKKHPDDVELERAHRQRKKNPSGAYAPGSRKMQTKTTWLTPYWDAWIAQYGGEPNGGVLSKVLKPLHDKLGVTEVLRRWRYYLDQTPAQYANPHRFASTFGSWEPKAEPMSSLSIDRSQVEM